jgi:hypothetical protein
MPAKSTKSATRKSTKATRKSTKATRKSNRPSASSSVISKSMSYTSNPSKGEPYGTFEEVVMKNGKGTRVTGKLNKSGKQIDKKESKINESQSRCMAINIRPLRINTLMPNPGPAFLL